MRRDKALLPWGDGDLLGHALARLRAVVREVRILGGATGRYGDRGAGVDGDSIHGKGPLAGLLTALETAGDGGALLLAVDLPLVPESLLARLLALAGSADAVVPVGPRGPEPLCAFYGAGCLDAVRRRIAADELRMTSFWSDVRVRELPPRELAAFGPADRLFLNVNTAADYDAALQESRRR